jgi:hypothetical protein
MVGYASDQSLRISLKIRADANPPYEPSAHDAEYVGMAS